VAGGDLQHLHTSRQLDQEFGVALQMVDAARIAA
jgi:hypothetical protein